MAHFFGRIQGQAGEATRLGSKRSGITSSVQTWGMALRADLAHEDYQADEDVLTVRFESLRGGRTAFCFTLENPDLVAATLDDVKMRHLFHRMNEIGRKISDEAPKAQKRIERKRKEQERAAKRKEKREEAIFDALMDDELRSLAEFCSFDSVEQMQERSWMVRDKLTWNEDGDVIYRVPTYNFDPPRVFNVTQEREER